MAVTQSQLPERPMRRRPLKRDEAGVTADFRKRYGLPGSGKLPLPPDDHPEAKAFARAVLRRAHQVKDVPKAQVDERVHRARKILGLPPKSQEDNEPGATIHASFRRKYGIPPSGPGPHADSDYKLPLPPDDHPDALKFAQAVLHRAHQVSGADPKRVASQVARARRIVDRHNKSKEARNCGTESKAWRESAWVDLRRPSGSSYEIVRPNANETLREFRRRIPSAVPADQVKSLRESQVRELTKRPFSIRIHESYYGPTGFVALSEDAGDLSVVKDVLLIRSGPGNRGDMNYYSPSCLEKAARSKVFDSERAFYDHPTPTEDREKPGRSVHEMAGWYDNVHTAEYDDPELGRRTTGLFGDFHPKIGDAEVQSLIRTCAEYARANPGKQFAGLSIDADGVGEPDLIDGEHYTRIDEITRVKSIDIVTRAGAGGAIIARAA